MQIYIYKIYFPANGKCYIGQTNNLKKRMREHLKSKYLVGNALRKYDEFEISVCHICSNKNDANDSEIRSIIKFNSITPNGYNVAKGGGVVSYWEGKSLSEDHKSKLSCAGLGIKKPSTGFAMQGNQHAKGHKNKAMSKRNKSMNKTPAHILKCKLTKLKKYAAKLEQELGD